MSQQPKPVLPDVLHPGRMVTTPQPYGYPTYGNTGFTFGKPVALDNTPPRSNGPKVRQILNNGKLV